MWVQTTEPSPHSPSANFSHLVHSRGHLAESTVLCRFSGPADSFNTVVYDWLMSKRPVGLSVAGLYGDSNE